MSKGTPYVRGTATPYVQAARGTQEQTPIEFPPAIATQIRQKNLETSLNTVRKQRDEWKAEALRLRAIVAADLDIFQKVSDNGR